MGIRKFFINNVRCFAKENEFNIRPLTFLVGENSTGKSTMLGCYHALHESLFGSKIGVNFNNEPYQMGGFDDIARKTNTQKKNQQFILGYEIEYGKNQRLKYEVTLIGNAGKIVMECEKLIFDDGEILLSHQEGSDNIDLEEKSKNQFIIKNPGHVLFVLYDIDSFLRYIIRSQKTKASVNLQKFIKEKIFSKIFNKSLLYSFAPIRSKPQRTYDPINEIETPEGNEIPIKLMNFSRDNKKEWEVLRKKLVNFGEKSGLFTDINIKTFSQSTNDPFQLKFKVRNVESNLMDIGYGISQILPILVRILIARGNQFLIQQPDVHLHPRGQAALTSLMVELVKNPINNHFIIETHTDYMIGRARIEIMQGNLKPEDLSLIYLEPKDNQVVVHNISFDDQANMIDVPAGYHDFFLKESDRLLGFS